VTKKKKPLLVLPPWLHKLGIAIAYVAWVGAVFILVQLLLGLLLKGILVAGIPIDTMNRVVLVTLLSVVVYSLTLWFVMWAPKKLLRENTTKKELGASRLPLWMDLALGPASFLPYALISGLLLIVAKALLPEANLTEAQQIGFSTHIFGVELATAFVLLVIIAPLVEELLFRGYLFGKLRQRVGLGASVVLVSLCFAALHGQLNVGIDTFALSIVLSLLREYTGSIWASVLLHATKNGIAFYVLFINPSLLSTMGL